MQASQPKEPARNDSRLTNLTDDLRERVMGSTMAQATIARTVPMVFAALLFVSPVLGQSGQEQGVQMCSTAGYNFMVGLVYLVCGVAIITIVGAIFSGGAMKAVGFVSSSVSRMGNHALVGGMASFGLIALTLGVAAVGFGTMPVSIPGECVTFF